MLYYLACEAVVHVYGPLLQQWAFVDYAANAVKICLNSANVPQLKMLAVAFWLR